MLISLSLNDLDWVYEALLCHFPKEEVKPKAYLARMLKNGDYALFAYEKEGEVLALALVFLKTSPALLDYFLVLENQQGQGIGSRFLLELEENPLLSGGLIVEAEALAHAKDEKDFTKRARRIKFYQRLGYKETILTPTIFGTTYTLFVSKKVSLEEETLKTTYKTIYHTMVPKALQKENILIP